MDRKQSVASESQARRCFEQIFPASLLPPNHFEPVVYGGTIRWAVLLGLELCIVPLNATDDKKVVRFQIKDVTQLKIHREDHFQFAEEQQTQRSAKVTVAIEELVTAASSPRSGGSSPLGRLFGSSFRKNSSDSGSDSPGPRNKKKRDELFYIFDSHTKIYEYLHQTWLSMLMCQLYGWTRVEQASRSKDKIKALYHDLVQEINKAASLQERVDLLDELALASRLNFQLKSLILLQTPAMIQYVTSELRKLTLEKWRQSPDLAQLGRPEALQYITVVLEVAHKTLFMAWPLFAAPENTQLLQVLMAPTTGAIHQLIAAIMAPLVSMEELKTGQLKTAASDVVHMCIAVLYQISQLLLEFRLDKAAAATDRNTELYAQVLVTNPQTALLERRLEVIFAAFKIMMLEMPPSPLRMVTMHNYGYVLYVLCHMPSPIRETIAKKHVEDVNLVLPRFIIPPTPETHPIERRSSVCFLKILSIFAPDQAKRLSTPELIEPL